jgi:quercetin dioxygenase-like cupin family protein
MKKLSFILFISAVLFFTSCNEDDKKDLSQSYPDEVIVETLARSLTSWNGDTLPEYPVGRPQITLLKITIPPHYKLHVHNHPVINAGVLLKGELTVVDEKNNILHLKAGDAIVEVVNTYHYGKNEGDEPVEIIVFYAGAESVPVTVIKEEK